MARVKSFIYPVACGDLSAYGELNDCTVRALSNATGKTYQYAHAHMKRHGRKERTGVPIKPLHEAYVDAGLALQGVYGTTNRSTILEKVSGMKAVKGVTLEKILPSLKGRYVVIITGHALAVKMQRSLTAALTAVASLLWQSIK